MKISCLFICCSSKTSAISPESFPTRSETTSRFTTRSYMGPIATKGHSTQEIIDLFKEKTASRCIPPQEPVDLFSCDDSSSNSSFSNSYFSSLSSPRGNIPSSKYRLEPPYRPGSPVNTINVLPRRYQIVPLNLTNVSASAENLSRPRNWSVKRRFRAFAAFKFLIKAHIRKKIDQK